jgi:sulfate adenylyltransferase subunit 2
MGKYNINYLDLLESESIHIIREAVAEFKNPVMLYSVGKDSSVLLRLAQKAFLPGKITFPLLHIDTGYKFKEMIKFRDYYIKKIGVKLIVCKNQEARACAMGPELANTDEYIYYKKTKPLLEAMEKYKFDAAFGGARREEEKSRAKERIFSFRDKNGAWNPKNQRPELWHIYNTKINKKETVRIFPLSNWTEADVWLYIKREKIEVVPLYFAKKMKVVRRHGIYLRLDEYVHFRKNERVIKDTFRYRTLGCSPSTGAVRSRAKTIKEIVKEVIIAKNSERENRAIDQGSDSNSMEEKKKEGYF